MKKSYKQAFALSVIMFIAGVAFMTYAQSLAFDEMFSGFGITGMVTGESQYSDFFAEMVLGSTIWLALWAVLCFFIFLIFIEYFLPKISKKRKKSGSK